MQEVFFEFAMYMYWW